MIRQTIAALLGAVLLLGLLAEVQRRDELALEREVLQLDARQ
ncbi:hypothetical protein [Massilia phyllosphaerae]|nr:hypothetical protein [Massilia sp. SGZ-792]